MNFLNFFDVYDNIILEKKWGYKKHQQIEKKLYEFWKINKFIRNKKNRLPDYL